jgi:hypothetical protein
MPFCTILIKNQRICIGWNYGICDKYLQEFQHVSRKIWDAKEEEGVVGEVLEGAVEKIVFSSTLWDCTQLCVNKYKNHGTMVQ